MKWNKFLELQRERLKELKEKGDTSRGVELIYILSDIQYCLSRSEKWGDNNLREKIKDVKDEWKVIDDIGEKLLENKKEMHKLMKGDE